MDETHLVTMEVHELVLNAVVGGVIHLANHVTNLCELDFGILKYELTSNQLEELGYNSSGEKVALKYLSSGHKSDGKKVGILGGGGLGCHLPFAQDDIE